MITTISRYKKIIHISNYKKELAEKINDFQKQIENKGIEVIRARFGGSDYNGNFEAIIFTLRGKKETAETRRPAKVASWKNISQITVVTNEDVFKIVL